MYNETPTLLKVSLQVSVFDRITNLASADFELPKKQPFLVSNEALTTVTLEVIPAASKTDEFVPKKFYPGDNPYLIRKVKKTAQATELIWGY